MFIVGLPCRGCLAAARRVASVRVKGRRGSGPARCQWGAWSGLPQKLPLLR